MQQKIKSAIKEAISGLNMSEVDFDVSATDFKNGDYASNAALVLAKSANQNPIEVANTFKGILEGKIDGVEKIEVAGPGFLNFFLKKEVFQKNLEETFSDEYGKNNLNSGKKIMIEYTDPNFFKEFHIGHLMSNTIGESIARLTEYSDATVLRANYQSDVGLNVAKVIYGMEKLKNEFPAEDAPLHDKVEFLGRAYVVGEQDYQDSEEGKEKIKNLNLKIFDKSSDILEFYNWGKKVSEEAFHEIYKKLGTDFDFYYLESDMAPRGLQIVRGNMEVFKESDGAIVFPGEEYDLHTRVFINSQGLPTYEAKELGLTTTKFEKINPDQSIVITANEQKGYFEVVLKALEQIYPDMSKKTTHLTHGLMKLSTGKMSSRKGNIVTGEALLSGLENLVLSHLEDKDFTNEERKNIVLDVAVSAIKYTILKQSIGKDITFDFEKSISFEGDSGPYLQYTAVRIKSLLRKAEEEGMQINSETPDEIGQIERHLYRFPEIVERAVLEISPQYVTTYLTELASIYNSFYAGNKIIGGENAEYKLYLSRATLAVLEKGLWLLGIKVPDKM